MNSQKTSANVLTSLNGKYGKLQRNLFHSLLSHAFVCKVLRLKFENMSILLLFIMFFFAVNMPLFA